MDLQDILARLKSPPAATSSDPTPTTSSYHHPSVSSPIASPSPSGPQPHHGSAVISPNTSAMNTPAPEQGGSDRAASLLNLLKLNQAAPSAPATTTASASDRRPSHNVTQNAHAETPLQGRAISASDLVASFMRKPPSSIHSPAIATPASSRADLRGEGTPPTENPQDLLLRLLNHRHASGSVPSAQQAARIPPQAEANKRSESVTSGDAQADPETSVMGAKQSKPPVRVFGSGQSGQSTSFEPVQTRNKQPIFTYVNPFEQLPTSSSAPRTPQPEDHPKSANRKVEILKHTKEVVSGGSGDEKDENFAVSGPAADVPTSSFPEPQTGDTVSEAVQEVAEQADKEFQKVLSSAELKSNGNGAAKGDNLVDKGIVEEVKSAAKETIDLATDLSKDLENGAGRKAAEETLSKPVTDALKDVVDDVSKMKVADDWEPGADTGDSLTKSGEFVVPVYNFPMRPFVSIDVKLPGSPIVFHEDTVMAIARCKKEFDQIDRNLVAASKNFICFAHAKHGGVRVVRQSTGQSKLAFSGSKERIFNVLMCAASTGQSFNDAEVVLGTGVNGTVFWVPIMSSRGNIFEQDELNDHALIFPAATAQEDNTSGSQLKTRAKTSSRHPEYFAVGRGKCIHLIHPTVAASARYTNQSTRVCDSEKYLKERTLKIITGKAGKDFAFSEDDTVIVSLDKAGRMRFWDIRELAKAAFETPSGPHEPMEIREPLLTLHTTPSNDKSWPTSVLFLDKERPFTKGIALRYLIVGMKQNHTLQLWDLGLGKAVQEINLPHENESDAICSIGYHPKSGVLAVCHPTRNSIYFIHVSAPRYNLNVLSQARYLRILSDNLSTPPKVDATAIMSGIREFSFAPIGQLRSLYLLSEPDTSNLVPHDEGPLFELYVMHSHGVACLGIRKEDLGWNKESTVVRPVNAEATGAISVNQLRQPQLSESSVGGESTAHTGASSQARESRKEATHSRHPSQSTEAAIRASTLAKVESKQDAARAAILNNGDKSEKKKKKKGSNAGDVAPHTATPTGAPSTNPQPVKEVLETAASKTMPSTAVQDNNLKVEDSSAPPAAGVDQEFISRELAALYKRVDEDRRVQDAANTARQDAVLRLVSSTLTENVEKSMTKLVTANVRDILLPGMTDTVTATIDRRLTEVLGTAVHQTIPQELRLQLPGALSRSLQEPDFIRLITELTATKVKSHIDTAILPAIKSSITSSFAALNSSQLAFADTERRLTEQLKESEILRQRDAVKIDQLSEVVRQLTQTVQSMASSQSEFQVEFFKLQAQAPPVAEGSVSGKSVTSTGGRAIEAPPPKSVEEIELDTIAALLSEGSFEEGTIMWLQSPRQAELFDALFVRLTPTYIARLSPLVALSVSAAVTSSFDKNVAERLQWLDAVLTNINAKDPEIVEVAPRIMDVLSSRLQGAYMQIAENDPTSLHLRRISSLARRALDLKAIASQARAP